MVKEALLKAIGFDRDGLQAVRKCSKITSGFSR